MTTWKFGCPAVAWLATTLLVTQAWGQTRYQPPVPGTGQEITTVGDDFEDPEWNYKPNLPKVYNDKDDALSENYPVGESANGRWYEGMKRGQPDLVRRIETPPGGLPGSTGALALRSLHTGSPRPTYRQQQEDFIANVAQAHGKIPVSQTPSVVTRVWLPPIDEWENRTGCHFAFRIALETYPPAPRSRGLFRPVEEDEFDGTYWPGMFIQMDSKEGNGGTGEPYDRVHIWMKAGDNGQRIVGPRIMTTGWWTLGMSITPDGRVHYFAKPGIEDLTAEDHIASASPFGYRALRFRTFFFNVCNGDDGKTWSTMFVVDDPKVYLGQAATTRNAGYQR